MQCSNRWGHKRINHLKRRDFITLLLGAAAWPLPVRAQRALPYRVGCLWVASEKVVKPYEEAIRGGLRDLGYVEGGNLLFEARYANGDARHLPPLVDEL